MRHQQSMMRQQTMVSHQQSMARHLPMVRHPMRHQQSMVRQQTMEKHHQLLVPMVQPMVKQKPVNAEITTPKFAHQGELFL